jgi:hypothetical protein
MAKHRKIILRHILTVIGFTIIVIMIQLNYLFISMLSSKAGGQLQSQHEYKQQQQ